MHEWPMFGSNIANTLPLARTFGDLVGPTLSVTIPTVVD